MFKKIISLFLSLSLIVTQPIFAQGVAHLNMTQYLGQARPAVIDIFRPTQLRYFSYDDIKNSFRILLDKGDAKDIKDNQFKQEARELMDYFLIGLTLPNDAFWVNLRPDSPENIIDPELEKTDLGRILLEADLQLKKDTAGLTSPQTAEGKAYWDKLYKKAGELFGTENITIPTITRPWIVPGEIIVRESGASAYIYKATLKVLLEQDHLKDSSVYNFSDPRLKELNEYSSQIIRETIIPKLTQEVNSNKRYAQLRQVYYSLVLSRWFKMRFAGKSGQYADLIDRHNLTNLTAKEPYDKLTYFKQYQESFAKGEYNLKEPVYTPYGQSIRAYMSGGFNAGNKALIISGVGTTVGSSIVGESLKNTANTVPLEVSGNNGEVTFSKQELPLAIAASPVVLESDLEVILEARKKLNEYHNDIKNFSKVSLSDLITSLNGTAEEIGEVKGSDSYEEQKEWLNIATELLLIRSKVVKNIEMYREQLSSFYAGIKQNPDIKFGEGQKLDYNEYSQTIKETNDPDEIIAAAEYAYRLVHGAASPVTMDKIILSMRKLVKNIQNNFDQYTAKGIFLPDNYNEYRKYIRSLSRELDESKSPWIIKMLTDEMNAEIAKDKEEAENAFKASNRDSNEDERNKKEVYHARINILNQLKKIDAYADEYEESFEMLLFINMSVLFNGILEIGQSERTIFNDELDGIFKKEFERLRDGKKFIKDNFYDSYMSKTPLTKYLELHATHFMIMQEHMHTPDGKGLNKDWAELEGFIFRVLRQYYLGIVNEINNKNAQEVKTAARKLKEILEFKTYTNLARINMGEYQDYVVLVSMAKLENDRMKRIPPNLPIVSLAQPPGPEGRSASPLIGAKLKDAGPVDFVKGGIDFTGRAMEIGIERMGSFVSSALVLPEIVNVATIDLDAEFKQIQLMASSGIRPSDTRILEFAAACYYRGEFGPRLGEITSCLQQAHFLDERLGRESSPALRLATILPEVM